MNKIFLSLIAICFGIWAGPNAGARILVDLDITTPQIDSVKTIAAGTLTAGIVCKSVVNLDSYSFDIPFDTSVLGFNTAVEDNPLAGLKNILKKNGGQALNVNLGLKSGRADTININNTLIGSDSAKAPEGDGLLGIILFNVRKSRPCTLSVRKVIFLDYEGIQDTSIALTCGILAPSVGNSFFADRTRAPMRPQSQALFFSRGNSGFDVRFPAIYDIAGRAVCRYACPANSPQRLPAGLFVVKTRKN